MPNMTDADELARLREEKGLLQLNLSALADAVQRALPAVANVLDLVSQDDAPDIRAALEAATAPIRPAEALNRILAGAARAAELGYVERPEFGGLMRGADGTATAQVKAGELVIDCDDVDEAMAWRDAWQLAVINLSHDQQRKATD